MLRSPDDKPILPATSPAATDCGAENRENAPVSDAPSVRDSSRNESNHSIQDDAMRMIAPPKKDVTAGRTDETRTAGTRTVKPHTAEILAAETSETGGTILSDAPPFELVSGETASAISLENSSREISLSEQFYATGTLPVGAKLGPFSIIGYIGGGGMGRVYKGEDQSLGRRVAIKVLPQNRAKDNPSVLRFWNEARLAARLNHEHIAQVYYCEQGEEEGKIPFIAFEYVEGINLRAYVEQNGVLDLPRGIDLLLQIAGALAHAAEHKVTHRDVKPSNILITPAGKAKLIDMGLARLKDKDSEEDLTVSGVTLGTFDYISPEQARDPRLADVRSDIYSLGCTFFFMLTGQPPFPEGTVLQKLLQHQGDTPPDVRKFAPDTPPAVVAVLQKMMAKDPAHRFQTPDELITTLKTIAENSGLAPPRPGLSEWMIPTFAQWRKWLFHLPWLVTGGVLLAAVGIYQWQTIRHDREVPPPVSQWSDGRGRPTIRPSSPGGGPAISPHTTPPYDYSPGVMRAFGTGLDRGPIHSSDGGTASPLSPPSPGTTGGPPDSNAERNNLADVGSLSFAPERYFGGFGAATVSLFESRGVDIPVGPSEPWRQGGLIPDSSLSEFSGRWSAMRDRVGPPDKPVRTVGNDSGRIVARVVDGIGEESGRFATLNSALRIENEGTPDESGRNPERVIELAVNGRVEISPMLLVGQNLVVRGAPGFRPVMTFSTAKNSQGAASTAMRLRNTRLAIQNLSLVVENVPDEQEESAIFELSGVSELFLIDATITVEGDSLGREVPPLDGIPPHPAERANFSENGEESRKKSKRVIARCVASAATEPPSDSSTGPVSPNSSFNDPFGGIASEGYFSPMLISATRSFLHGETGVVAIVGAIPVRLDLTATAFDVTGGLLVADRIGVGSGETIPTVTLSLDRCLGVSRGVLIREERLIPGVSPFTIRATFTRSLFWFDNQPVGEVIVPEPSGRFSQGADWNFSETFICNAPALWRWAPNSTSGESRLIRLPSGMERRFENVSGDLPRLATVPSARMTRANLIKYLLRPAVPDTLNPSDQAVLDAIESGISGAEE